MCSAAPSCLPCHRLGCALLLFFTFLGESIAASDAHTWKPTADWYPPDLIITKLVPRTVEQSEVRYQEGDDVRWAAPDWDDSAWTEIERNRVPLHAGIFWLRVRIRTRGANEPVPMLVRIGESGAYDFYWDGKPVRSSGVPANRAEAEVAGTNRIELMLAPDATRPGEHVIALRMSTYHRLRAGADATQLRLFTLPADDYHDLDRRQNMLCALAVGAMFTTSIAVFVMWLLAARRLILMLMFGLCLSAAALISVSAAPSVWEYPATWIYWLSLARLGLVVAVAGLLIAAVMLQFHPRHRRWLIVPLVVETIAAWSTFSLGVGTLFVLWRIAFGSVILLAGEAVWHRREGAGYIFAGVAVVLFVFEHDPRHFDAARFLWGFLPMLIGLIAAIAVSVRRERQAAHDTKLAAARLEIELLRKSLQPHFLLNTLTALAQVVEEKPSAAVSLINDLAAELRSLNRLSTEKQVLLRDELALCHAHLRVMSARTERTWSLETDGIDPDASVPPALFLTLIENGFSHQRVVNADRAFRLRAERMEKATRYTFSSPGVVTTPAHEHGGTGLRYVRSRLDESFHGAWTLSQRPADRGWETVIELRHSAPRPNTP